MEHNWRLTEKDYILLLGGEEMSVALTLQQVLSMGFYAEKIQQVQQHLHDVSLRQFEQETRRIFDEKKIEVPTCEKTSEIHPVDPDRGTNHKKQYSEQQNKQPNDYCEQEEKIPVIEEALGFNVDIEV